MFSCYGCHYMRRIFKTPRLRSEVYMIKAGSFWPLRGNFLIQLLPLEHMRSRQSALMRNQSWQRQCLQELAFPPLGLHILSPVLFSFLLFSLLCPDPICKLAVCIPFQARPNHSQSSGPWMHVFVKDVCVLAQKPWLYVCKGQRRIQLVPASHLYMGSRG